MFQFRCFDVLFHSYASHITILLFSLEIKKNILIGQLEFWWPRPSIYTKRVLLSKKLKIIFNVTYHQNKKLTYITHYFIETFVFN